MYAHWILGSLRLLPSGLVSDLQPLSYVALCHLPERRSGSHEWSPLSQALISSLTHTVSVFILALAPIHPILPQWPCLPPWACRHLDLLSAMYTLWEPRCCPRFTALTSWCIPIEISIWTHILWSPVQNEYEAPCSKSCSVSRQWWRVSSLVGHVWVFVQVEHSQSKPQLQLP